MRKKEFMKKSEARIIIYLSNVDNYAKSGSRISEKLKIDYIYIMKVLREMYQKGWVKVHEYNQTTYFEPTMKTPVKEAKKRLTNYQSTITT